MKKWILSLIAFLLFSAAKAQKIDSIYVHLYTDSLKKGTYNYINIDGKLSNGRYLPLDTSQITLSSNGGKFYGNSLYLPPDFDRKKVTIKVVLKSDPSQEKIFDISIKQKPDPELKSEQEILNERNNNRRRKG